MDSSAELATRTEAHHAYLVTVLLAEECDSSHLLCFFKRSVAVLIKRQVLAYHVIDDAFGTAQLFVGNFLEVGEVEAQRVGTDVRTFLFHMVAQHLLQCIVQKVGCRVVGSAAVALVRINAGHEVGLRMLWQFLYDVYALVVLAFCVDHGHGFVFAHKYAAVAYLSTHLTVERCVVEYEFVVCILFLCYLAVAQYAALMLGVVVAYELLFAWHEFGPVGAFHLCGVACALFLLLHFCVKLLFVDRQSVLAAYQLGQVKRETVGVEQAECLCAVEFCAVFGLCLFHSGVEQGDTFVEGA